VSSGTPDAPPDWSRPGPKLLQLPLDVHLAAPLDPTSSTLDGWFVAAETLGAVATPDPALEQRVLALGERLLGHATAFRRRQGAELLATLGTAPVARAMLARLRAGSTRDAGHALDVLEQVATEAACPELLEVALDQTLDATRRARAGALAARLGGDGVPTEEEEAPRPPPAAPATARAWDPRVDPAPLLAALGVPGEARRELLATLGGCRDPRVLDALVPIAVDYADPAAALLALAALRETADLVVVGALQGPSEALTGEGPSGLEPADRRALALATAEVVRACLARRPRIPGRVAAGLLERWGSARWSSSLWWWLEESGDDEVGTAAGEVLALLGGDRVVGKE
jgi:hypothetical protein